MTAKGGRDDSASAAEDLPIDDGFDEISGLELNVEDEVLMELEKLGSQQQGLEGVTSYDHDPYDTQLQVQHTREP
jgi:hypothetical protein